jgi:LmbE family N-acetylglucosaminyl deacetylase
MSKKNVTKDAAPPVFRVVDPAEGINKVLVITAHPDDVDFGAGGTIARLTDAGVEVVYCLVTDGDAGGSDVETTYEQRAAIRRVEQTKAATLLGVTELHFLGHLDGAVTYGATLRRDLSRVIRKVRPDVVIAQSPERNLDRIYASHPDHLAAGESALAAVYPDARNPFAYPELLDSEGLEPHTVNEVWLMASPVSDVAVETTNVLPRKLAALRCHESQVGDGEHLDELITTWGRTMASLAGLKKKQTAEAFRVVNTR